MKYTRRFAWVTVAGWADGQTSEGPSAIVRQTRQKKEATKPLRGPVAMNSPERAFTFKHSA